MTTSGGDERIDDDEAQKKNPPALGASGFFFWLFGSVGALSRVSTCYLSPPYRRRIVVSFRKEVIQPQVPLRLPCYDLVPIDRFVFGACPLAVGTATSDAPIFRGLTGGVYKAQEHIHRSVADLRLLAIPTS